MYPFGTANSVSSGSPVFSATISSVVDPFKVLDSITWYEVFKGRHANNGATHFSTLYVRGPA